MTMTWCPSALKTRMDLNLPVLQCVSAVLFILETHRHHRDSSRGSSSFYVFQIIHRQSYQKRNNVWVPARSCLPGFVFRRSAISLRSLSAPRSFCSFSAPFAVLARKQHTVLSVTTDGFVEGRNPLDPIELRSPQEYITIAKAVGLSADKANEAVHRNPLKALEHGSFWIGSHWSLEKRKAEEKVEILDEAA